MKVLKKICLFLLVGVLGCFSSNHSNPEIKILNKGSYQAANKGEKMKGISFESPARSFPIEDFNAIDSINANWIALIPFGFTYPTGSKVHYNSPRQWWGERPEGIRTLIQYAHEKKLKVMLKPQVWIPGGWVGAYELKKEEKIAEWKETYRDFILTFAEIAAEFEIALFCVGTEYKLMAVQHPDCWRALIAEVRTIYKGKITYASNWDHYQAIPFWEELDYIGVNGYFPLVEQPTPTPKEIAKAWQPIIKQLGDFSKEQNKPILFTEMGYMSCDYAAWRTWENESQSPAVNSIAQANAYEGLFNSIWKEDWFAGIFLWEWHHNHKNAGGNKDKHYTPQNKPAQQIIKQGFSRN